MECFAGAAAVAVVAAAVAVVAAAAVAAGLRVVHAGEQLGCSLWVVAVVVVGLAD